MFRSLYDLANALSALGGLVAEIVAGAIQAYNPFEIGPQVIPVKFIRDMPNCRNYAVDGAIR